MRLRSRLLAFQYIRRTHVRFLRCSYFVYVRPSFPHVENNVHIREVLIALPFVSGKLFMPHLYYVFLIKSVLYSRKLNLRQKKKTEIWRYIGNFSNAYNICWTVPLLPFAYYYFYCFGGLHTFIYYLLFKYYCYKNQVALPKIYSCELNT